MDLTAKDIGKYYLVQTRKDSIFYYRTSLYSVLENGDLIFMASAAGHKILVPKDRILREVDKDIHPYWKMEDGKLIKN